ncbi:G patch domain-containing protein 4 [Latimeria chalumnae]|uniref:G patch domain-containing protein 4 n=1 Tax=Latimeria chalumnae TaxID=7897 RepID=H3AN02_LATCH|nr:PREDICTED: G patch domain-containing protein 4 [Latimeria chalumnae]|eukprot:XP_006000331.1 PREDICTED: G patch domain-containing protein 4 [Latimeria chalumnae]
MSSFSNRKSSGLKFAEQQLQKHGWQHGKGLGRRENGIQEAIKVKIKCDSAGVGHNVGEQFTFHWWDHAFNKAASNISVESKEDGVQVKKTSVDDGKVSNKKPWKQHTKDRLYGHFIKAATLMSGGEQPVVSESSESIAGEEEDPDLSSSTKLTDEELVRACGGRTAHKGARHGLTMSAKLARLEKQEQEFLAKYTKNNQASSSWPKLGREIPQTVATGEEGTQRTKKKKKRKSKESDPTPQEGAVELSERKEPKLKKLKKEERETETQGVEEEKRKKKREIHFEPEAAILAESELAALEDMVNEKKKKRKKKKEIEETEMEQNTTVETKKKKRKKNKEGKQERL